MPLSNSLRRNRVQHVSQDCTDEEGWGWRIMMESHSPPKLNLKFPLSDPHPCRDTIPSPHRWLDSHPSTPEAPHNLEFQQDGVGDSYPGARAQRPLLFQPQHLRAARLASGIGAANAAGAAVPATRATPPAQNRRWLSSSAACTTRVSRARLVAPAPALRPRRAPGTERG